MKTYYLMQFKKDAEHCMAETNITFKSNDTREIIDNFLNIINASFYYKSVNILHKCILKIN